MLKTNYRRVLKLIPPNVKLITVSKFKPIEDIKTLYSLGQRDFGENRVQEFLEKFEILPIDIRWHFIGTLQTNKVKYLVNKTYLIHSLDSLPLAKEIEKCFSKLNSIAQVLIQINIGKDHNKSGIISENIYEFIQELALYPHIKVLGFMTILPIVDIASTVILYKEMKSLYERYRALQSEGKLPSNINISELSMGMSDDFVEALENGATMVRVGSRIFGQRN